MIIESVGIKLSMLDQLCYSQRYRLVHKTVAVIIQILLYPKCVQPTQTDVLIEIYYKYWKW